MHGDKMSNNSWNEKLEYLKMTRQHMWNDDYFEFLVKCVWHLDKPVNVMDFGCGYGYLGMKLMPLLPKGSTYTGIDIAENLLEEAKNIFADTEYNAEFIKADLLEYEPQKQYDVVICQSVLRHIPKTKDVLRRMIDAATLGGIVICIEPNRRMENAGLYIDDVTYDTAARDNFLQEHWKNELANGGRDYLIESRVPIYMEELGLKDIGVRVNDFVEFVSPNSDKEDYSRHKKTFLENNLVSGSEINTDYLVGARCHLISYGYKMNGRKMYLDVSETNGCTSVFIKDTEIINAGTTVYSMSIKHKNAEYERYAQDYDIHFIFEDNMPFIDFYTIPQVDIFATDSQGGYLGTIGCMTDLESDAPICYIDKRRICYLIADSGTEFMQKAASWSKALKTYKDVKFYASKKEAMSENEFIDINKFDKGI